MSQIIGGVEVTGFISPTDSTDQYAVIDPIYGVDGLRNVTSISALNAISIPRRRAGMIVGVTTGTTTTYYSLLPSPWTSTISDWKLFQSGVSSASITGGTFSTDTLILSGNSTPVVIPQLSENVIYNSGLSSNLSTSYSIGGLAAGTPLSAISGTTLISLLNTMLFPVITPIVHQPSYGLGYTISSNSTTATAYFPPLSYTQNLIEITTGITRYNMALVGSYNAGSISINGVTTQSNAAGASTNYFFSGQSTSSYNTTLNSYTPTFIAITGTNRFDSAVSYAIGPMPLDNHNNQYPSLRVPAGTSPLVYVSVEGVFPIYATINSVAVTTSTLSSGDKQALISMMVKPQTVVYTFASEYAASGAQKLWVPTALSTNVNFYHQNSGANFNPPVLETTAWTSSLVTINGISYTCYTHITSGGGQRGSLPIQITFN